MAKYRVLERSFMHNRTYEAGDIVEWDGIPADNLEPICKDSVAAAKAAKDAGIPTAVETDWNPTLSIADAARSLAGTTAAQDPKAVAAAQAIIDKQSQTARESAVKAAA